MLFNKNIAFFVILAPLFTGVWTAHAMENVPEQEPVDFWVRQQRNLGAEIYHGARKSILSSMTFGLLTWAAAPKRHAGITADAEHGFFALHGADLLTACIKVWVAQFKEDGDGSKATTLVAKSIGRALRELVGQDAELAKAFLSKALKDGLQWTTKELKDEGEIKAAFHELLVAVRKELQQDGELKALLEHMANVIHAQALIKVRELGDTIGLMLEEHTDRLSAVLETRFENLAQKAEVRAKNIQENVESGVFRTALKIGAITILTVGAIYGTKVLWNQIERSLNTPKLVIESSQKSFWQKMTQIFVRQDDIPEMVFSADLKKRLDTITAATSNIREKISRGQRNVKYRNLILWGPPGTGKTMFAKILARKSGMDYVMISGASFAQFKEGQGITEMNKLFEWAKKSENGVLIFIDEAESFLGGRIGNDVTKESYQILNNFLNHTGTRSDKFMIVVATNHPEFLDSAMPSRLDDAVEIKLPELIERAKIIRLYRDSILLDIKQNTREFVESVKIYFNDETIEKIAQKTENFSGRELAGVINGIVTDAAVTDNGMVSDELIISVVDFAVKKNHDFAKQLHSLGQLAAAAA